MVESVFPCGVQKLNWAVSLQFCWPRPLRPVCDRHDSDRQMRGKRLSFRFSAGVEKKPRPSRRGGVFRRCCYSFVTGSLATATVGRALRRWRCPATELLGAEPWALMRPASPASRLSKPATSARCESAKVLPLSTRRCRCAFNDRDVSGNGSQNPATINGRAYSGFTTDLPLSNGVQDTVHLLRQGSLSVIKTREVLGRNRRINVPSLIAVAGTPTSTEFRRQRYQRRLSAASAAVCVASATTTGAGAGFASTGAGQERRNLRRKTFPIHRRTDRPFVARKSRIAFAGPVGRQWRAHASQQAEQAPARQAARTVSVLADPAALTPPARRR